METKLQTLIELAAAIAKRRADGHLSIMKFTTGWKVVMGTPILEPMSEDYDRLLAMPTYASIETALQAFVENPVAFTD